MARPGIMLYFDILGPLKMLSDEDKGRLLVAMLEYGRDGTVPELDGSLGIVWSFVLPMIDKDGQRYEDMKLQREYANFCKKRKKIWMPKVSFDDWVIMTDDERQRAVDPVASRTTFDNERHRAGDFGTEPNRAGDFGTERNPTTTTVTATTPTNNSNLQRTTNNVQLQLQPQLTTSTDNLHPQEAAATAAENQVNVVGGELGKGVVFLSEEQIGDLLDRMGLETFDFYVDKLSTFIIKNDARVKNHYETILKWWKEDGAVRGPTG